MINNAGLLTLNKLEMTEYNGVYLVCWILTETVFDQDGKHQILKSKIQNLTQTAAIYNLQPEVGCHVIGSFAL